MRYFVLFIILAVGWFAGFICCVVTRPGFQWTETWVPEGSCNICLGYKAGEELTDETFQFVFTIPEFCDFSVEWKDGMVRTEKRIAGFYEYQTTMTPKEYEIIVPILRRAGKNYSYIEVK